MSNKEFLSKNREYIMGAAALWVMIFHGIINVPIRPIQTVIRMGYLGVDIFVFMSGFSMWHSYNHCEKNYKVFLSKRLKRILPSFIPFAIIWLIQYLVNNYHSADELVAATKTITFWLTILVCRWFIPCILLCYAITPLVDSSFVKRGVSRQTLLKMIALCVVIALPFAWLQSSVALMILIRIPEYMIGWSYAAAEDVSSESISVTRSTPPLEKSHKKEMWVRAGIVLIMYAFYYFLFGAYSDVFLADTGLYWWAAVACASSMTILLSRTKFICNKVFRFMGKYSLELYLWHAFIVSVISKLLYDLNVKFDEFGIIQDLISIVIACGVAVGYARVISFEKNGKLTL